MRAPGHELDAGERGFILVGVVMFMLALTILGMSLFALSSYEAQFFTASASRQQSMQNAESGMELVKTLLQMEPHRLENAQLAVGQRGVKRAMAYQWRSTLATDTTSSGSVNWDSTIVLVVTAVSGGAERTIQARYIPTPRDNPYKLLITAGQGVRYDTANDPPIEGFEIRGRVWQHVDSASDTAWTGLLTWPNGRPLITSQPARPLSDAFVDAHLPSATIAALGGGGPYTMLLSNSGGGAKFFSSPASPSDGSDKDEYDWYSFYVDEDLRVRVRGTVVWVVPQGVCFRRNVTVEPADENVPGTLVLVAKANHRDPYHDNRGIWLQGGISVTDDNVHVYLVSEGDIGITRAHNKFASEDADRLSVVAGGQVELGGPVPGYRQVLEYEAETMHPLADLLLSIGALPQLSSGTAMSFIIARSSWAETTPR